MAANLLMGISKDERERAVFRSRTMFRMDYKSDMATAWDVGMNEGYQPGGSTMYNVANSAIEGKDSF